MVKESLNKRYRGNSVSRSFPECPCWLIIHMPSTSCFIRLPCAATESFFLYLLSRKPPTDGGDSTERCRARDQTRRDEEDQDSEQMPCEAETSSKTTGGRLHSSHHTDLSSAPRKEHINTRNMSLHS